MDSKYFGNYSISFELNSPRLRSYIVGRDGKTKRMLETKNKVTMEISKDDAKVVISGRRNNVKNTEIEIGKLLSERYFMTEMDDHYLGEVLGKNGINVQRIRSETDALINIKSSTNTRFLEIIGTKESVKKAKNEILDLIGEKISQEFDTCKQKLFRKREIELGCHKTAKFVLDQIKPTPQLFYIDFGSTLNIEEENYTNEYASGKGKPLDVVHKMGGVLAPYDGILYRGKVLDYSRENDELLLLIQFVDFGNTSWVSFFECRKLLDKYLYPPHATPCQLMNIDQKSYSAFHTSSLLKVFRKAINASSVIEEVETVQTHRADELVLIKISISGIGDLGDHLVQKNVAAMPNDPFAPLEGNHVGIRGSITLVYITNGIGDLIPIRVESLARQNDQDYIFGRNFKEDMVESLDSAYACAKRILSSRGNDVLNRYTLKFIIDDHYSYGGPSFGVALSILIISECLELEIPPHVIFTGTISKNGNVGKVGSINQKLLASKSHGKLEFYVPRSNYLEATNIKVRGLEVKPMDNIETVLKVLKFD